MIYLASDHAGFELKEEIKKYLNEQGFAFEDVGPFKLDEEDDYPDYVFPAARKVAEDKENRGIIFGGSGQGEAMAANRVIPTSVISSTSGSIVSSVSIH